MLTIRVALDSNGLVYAEEVNGEERKSLAGSILKGSTEKEIVPPAQALGELCAVLTRKARWPAAQARAAVLGWQNAYPVADTSAAVLMEVMKITCTHQFSLWDAVVMAIAAQGGCRLLLSENMHDDFTWRSVTMRDPFASADLTA